MRPVRAAVRGGGEAARAAPSVSAITWSAASSHSTASGSSSATRTAAAAMAGALLRPTGSSRMRGEAMPAARSCSAIRNRCSWLQTMTGGAKRVAAGAERGFLEQGVVGDQRPELLGEALARDRPEPGAGAAGQDDRDDRGGVHAGGMCLKEGRGDRVLTVHGVLPPGAWSGGGGVKEVEPRMRTDEHGCCGSPACRRPKNRLVAPRDMGFLLRARVWRGEAGGEGRLIGRFVVGCRSRAPHRTIATTSGLLGKKSRNLRAPIARHCGMKPHGVTGCDRRRTSC